MRNKSSINVPITNSPVCSTHAWSGRISSTFNGIVNYFLQLFSRMQIQHERGVSSIFVKWLFFINMDGQYVALCVTEINYALKRVTRLMWRKHYAPHLSFWWGEVNKKCHHDNITINPHHIFNIQFMFLCLHNLVAKYWVTCLPLCL